jgi:hypothetical protein
MYEKEKMKRRLELSQGAYLHVFQTHYHFLLLDL